LKKDAKKLIFIGSRANPAGNPKSGRGKEKARKESSFCEQKEAKKLYSFGTIVKPSGFARGQMNKSFLLLFFKKEGLPFASS
jgi:hypothetical protein